LFVLLGTQAEVWCRLGPSETPGIFFLSIALWLTGCAAFAKRPRAYEVSAILFLLLSSLCKESFVIFIPFIVGIYIWIIHQYRQLPIKNIFLKKLPFIAVLLLICSVELFIIFRYVGTSMIGYAGVDGLNKVYIKNIYVSLKEFLFSGNNNDMGIYFFILIGTLWYVKRNRKIDNKTAIRSVFEEIAAVIFISIAALIAQLILYMKSGMEERYLLPSTLALTFLIFYLAQLILKSDTNKTVHFLLTCFFCITLFNTSLNCFRRFKNFSKDGISTNKFLSAIKKSTVPSDSILFVGNPTVHYEWSWSNKIYFASSMNYRKNIFFYFLLDKEIHEFDNWNRGQVKSAKDLFGNGLYENNVSVNYTLIALPMNMDALLQSTDFPLGNYVKESFGNEWILYHKK
jgi:hypothetical protein